ncbi:MAG: DNA primase family protein, partial [Mycobacteriaceae bacterium]
KWAAASQNMARIKAMVEAARTLEGIVVPAGDLDKDSWLFNVQNGTLDLHTGTLRPHDRNDHLTEICPVAYNPAASCPTWDAFVSRVLHGSEDLIRFVQRAVGYTLTGTTTERVLFFAHGSGRNGKSTLLETLRYVFGDYAVHSATALIMAKSHDGGPTPDIAKLQGARFVTVSETEEDTALDTASIKQLTGGDTISARYLHENPFEFQPTFKLWLGSNFEPQVSAGDQAIWDRIRKIPFTVRIPDEEVDPTLRDKLIAEGEGILAWAVRGCLDWQREGLGTAPEIEQATAAYREGQDLLGEFAEDRLVFGPDQMISPQSRGWNALREWCQQNGASGPNRHRFADFLRERGAEDKKSNGVRQWRGVGLAADQAGGEGRYAAEWETE